MEKKDFESKRQEKEKKAEEYEKPSLVKYLKTKRITAIRGGS